MALTDSLISLDEAKIILSYDHEAGIFIWNSIPSCRFRSIKAFAAKSRRFGLRAGTTLRNGYESIFIDGKRYYSHRLAWLFIHGRWPENDIDHINGNRMDNRACNLREASRSENHQNRKGSMLTGASWHEKAGKWRSSIVVNGRHKHLGYFDTAEEAALAYRNAKHEKHKFQPEVRITEGG